MSDATTPAASPICARCGAPLPGGAGGAATSCPHCGAPLPGAAEALGVRADRRRALRVFTLFGRSAALTFAVPGLLAAGLAFGMLTTAGDMVPAAVRFGFPLVLAAGACMPLVLTLVFHAGLRSMIEPDEPNPPE